MADGIWQLGVSNIKTHIRSDRKVDRTFLEDLKRVLLAEDFDIDNNILIIKSSMDEIEYSTKYTMVDLEFDASDAVERLKGLTIADYSEILLSLRLKGR